MRQAPSTLSSCPSNTLVGSARDLEYLFFFACFYVVSHVLYMRMDNVNASETQMGGSVQIVLARVEMTGLKATGKNVCRDLNWFPEYVAAPEAKACVWLNEGTAEDVKKAEVFAKTEGYTVYTFQGEKNPTETARKLALEDFKAAS